mmetsp:Transcript_8911/g.14079  ORF Transcript_8911/g.14079 Transcript_8911/m.14079 type:complete len:179 (+) Transcript_8911:302-838(+)
MINRDPIEIPENEPLHLYRAIRRDQSIDPGRAEKGPGAGLRYGKGVYFTPCPKDAVKYANKRGPGAQIFRVTLTAEDIRDVVTADIRKNELFVGRPPESVIDYRILANPDVTRVRCSFSLLCEEYVLSKEFFTRIYGTPDRIQPIDIQDLNAPNSTNPPTSCSCATEEDRMRMEAARV